MQTIDMKVDYPFLYDMNDSCTTSTGLSGYVMKHMEHRSYPVGLNASTHIQITGIIQARARPIRVQYPVMHSSYDLCICCHGSDFCSTTHLPLVTLFTCSHNYSRNNILMDDFKTQPLHG